MSSGLATLGSAGASTNPVPRFSVAVMVYRCFFPVLIARGILTTHRNFPALAFQPQYALRALMPGPARVTRTLRPAARCVARLVAIGLPVVSVRRKVTVIVCDDLATVDLGRGDMNPLKPYRRALKHP